MQRCLYITLFSILFFAKLNAQYFSFAKKKHRDSIVGIYKNNINTTINNPINAKTIQQWKEACWAMQLMLYKPPMFEKKVAKILADIDKTPTSFQQFFLETIYTLYPSKFSKELLKIWYKLSSNKAKAIVLEQLALAKIFPKISRDSLFSNSNYFVHYSNRIFNSETKFPSLKEFLQPHFLPNQNVLISVQHRNRNKVGYIIIRNKSNQFIVDDKNEIISFPQLARSISNLPWYIANGNTPQGLYKINGIDSSNNLWIGPTKNLQMVLPFEDSNSPFFLDTAKSYNKYVQLLGNLAKYANLFQSYYAGKLGRSEIIAHGTTIPEWFYKNQPYYPCTPSLGCLCSPEIWDNNGLLKKSSQQEWIRKITESNLNPTYILVVEID